MKGVLSAIASLFAKEADGTLQPAASRNRSQVTGVVNEASPGPEAFSARAQRASNKSDSASQGHSASSLRRPRSENAEFDAALASRLGDEPSVLAGTLELGLDEVRNILGDRWPLFETAIIKLTQKELSNTLHSSDVFHRCGDASFLIHFGQGNKIDAEEKTKHVTLNIKSALNEAIPDVAQSISVRSFVASIDREDIEHSGAGLSDALFMRLLSLREDALKTVQRNRNVLRRSLDVSFSPVWHSKKEVTLFNRCCVQCAHYDSLSMQLRELGEHEEAVRIAAEADSLVLVRSFEALHRWRQAGQSGLLLVPVSLDTILSPESRKEYLRLLEAAPDAYRNDVKLEICGVGLSTNSEEAFNAINSLPARTRELVVQLPLDDRRISEFAVNGTWGISTDISAADVLDPALADQLQRFSAADGVKGVISIAKGAHSFGLATAALDAGFTFIEGHSIGLPSREIRKPFRLRAQSLRSRDQEKCVPLLRSHK